jgi:hypothetical protein
VVTACGIDGRAYQSSGELLTCLDVVRAAADLESTVRAAIYRADVQMCVRNGLTGLHKTYHDTGDILSHFMELFYLETAGEKLVLQLLGRAVYIYIFF